MTVQEIASDLVARCRGGDFDSPGELYWADDVASYEAMTGDMAEVRGKDAVRSKGEWWSANHEVHGVEVEGPYLNGDQFAVRFKMDITAKETGQRMLMDEVAIYTIRNGKIAEERFFY